MREFGAPFLSVSTDMLEALLESGGGDGDVESSSLLSYDSSMLTSFHLHNTFLWPCTLDFRFPHCHDLPPAFTSASHINSNRRDNNTITSERRTVGDPNDWVESTRQLHC